MQKTLQKTQNLVQKCEQKSDNSYTESPETLQTLIDLIDISPYISHPDLNPTPNTQIKQILSQEFLQDFRKTLENNQNSLQ